MSGTLRRHGSGRTKEADREQPRAPHNSNTANTGNTGNTGNNGTPCRDDRIGIGTPWMNKASKTLLPGSALLLMLPEPVLAAPWAPAHGWRRKQGEQYVGYPSSRCGRDYGIVGGRCDRQAIGAAAGAVLAGVIGSHVSDGDHHGVATMIGAVIDSVIGAHLAASMDESDLACIGHSLALEGNNTPVNRVNPATRIIYVLTPVGGYQQDGRVCREFTLCASSDREKDSGRAFACQMRDGTWQLAQKEGSRKNREDRDPRDDRDDHPGKCKGRKHG